MSRYFAFIIIIQILFLGCANTNLQKPKQNYESFVGEDLLSLQALMEAENGNIQNAIDLYIEIYNKNNNLDYLKQALHLSFSSFEDHKELNKLLAIAKNIAPNDSDIIRIEASKLMEEKQYIIAEDKMLNLIKREKTPQNLNLLSLSYFYQGKYEQSLKFFESSYQIKNDPEVLLKIVNLLSDYLDNREKEAIAYLETESRINGCTVLTCYKLIEIYGKNKNIDGLISVYKKLYSRYKTKIYSTKVVELLIYKNAFPEAIKFLNETKTDDKMLITLYATSGHLQEAHDLAKVKYAETKDVEFLGRMAIYEYEMISTNITNKKLIPIINKFEEMLLTLRMPLYLNYYGYLLIDHDLDIKKGIKLVEEALVYEPNSAYYIDSLAWGHYKLGNCEKAMELMNQILHNDNNEEEEEIINHYKMIKKCFSKLPKVTK